MIDIHLTDGEAFTVLYFLDRFAALLPVENRGTARAARYKVECALSPPIKRSVQYAGHGNGGQGFQNSVHTHEKFIVVPLDHDFWTL